MNKEEQEQKELQSCIELGHQCGLQNAEQMSLKTLPGDFRRLAREYIDLRKRCVDLLDQKRQVIKILKSCAHNLYDEDRLDLQEIIESLEK